MTDAQTDRPRPRYNDETDEWIVAVRGTIEYAFDTMDEARAFAAKQHLDTTKPECGICGITDPPEVTHECPAGFATTTPSPNEAEIRADERRRIDESIERFQDGEFTVAIAEKGGWCVIDPPLGDCSGLPSLGNGDSPLRAILAATQSIQAEAGDGA